MLNMYVNMNTFFHENNLVFLKSELLSKKNSIVLHLGNLFNVWLNRRQLHSPAHFCIQSVVRSHITRLLENFTGNSGENESGKGR